MDGVHTENQRISIQVSLSGYSFNGRWFAPEELFREEEFRRRHDSVELSLLTPKVALVPSAFFRESTARDSLMEVAPASASDNVEWVEVPEFGAVLVYSLDIGETLSRVLAQTVLPVSGVPVRVLPELYYLLKALPGIEDYNKIAASWKDGWLHLAVAQGKTLCLANVFPAPDFTTAQYYLFLSMKQLQLNPEISTACFRTPLDMDQTMSLYRYFKSVSSL